MNLGDISTEVIAGVFLQERPQQRSMENPNLPLNDPAVWEEVFGTSFKAETGENITPEKAMMYAPLWHAVTMISGDVARMPLRIYRRRPDLGEDARERDRGHPLSRVLGVAANEETESVKFWGRFMAHALLWGNAYAYIVRDGSGRPSELINLLPDRTQAERVSGRLLYVTELADDDGPRLHALLPEDVLHIEGLSVGTLGGMTLFRMARNSIALGLAQERFASKFFRHGGRVGGILELPVTMNKGARDKVEEGFRRTYEGSENPFKTVVLRDNAKFHSAQQSPRESQMVEATEGQTRQIAHWFNLMPSKLGLSDSVSYNSKAEDNQAYLDTTLSIWLTRIAAACNFRLLTPEEQETHFVEHNTSDLLRMNLLSQAQAFQILVTARVMNPNECRAKLNMLPYEGGEEFVNPNTMTKGSPEDEDGPEEGDPEPEEDEDEEETPARSQNFLRMLFSVSNSAREKANNPKAMLAWVDHGMKRHKDEWSKISGGEEFPFETIIADLNRNLQTWTNDELSQRVDEWCVVLEKELSA
jgi:HK97 family phage portal protein